MANKLRDLFIPEVNLINKKLTSTCPCDNCDTYKEYQMKSIYGDIAERQYAELPNICETCISRFDWLEDCLIKLKWYEENDKRLKELVK